MSSFILHLWKWGLQTARYLSTAMDIVRKVLNCKNKTTVAFHSLFKGTVSEISSDPSCVDDSPDLIQYSTLQYSTVQYSTVQYSPFNYQ